MCTIDSQSAICVCTVCMIHNYDFKILCILIACTQSCVYAITQDTDLEYPCTTTIALWYMDYWPSCFGC